MRSAPLLALFDGGRTSRPRRVIGVRPRAAVAAGMGLSLISAASGAALFQLFLVSDMAETSLGREAKLARRHEETIRTLQARADEAASRDAEERRAIEKRVRELIARQEAFETRQGVIQAYAEDVGLGHEAAAPAAPSGEVAVTGPDTPHHAYAPDGKRSVDDIFQLRLRRPEPPSPAKTSALETLERELARAALNLDRFERRQARLLGEVVQTAEAEAFVIESAIRDAGLDPFALLPSGDRSGGPLVPLDAGSSPFDFLASQASTSLDRLGELRRASARLPFAEPISGEAGLSSGFGYRIDPFTRSPAMHTGVDFRADFGAPARATGAGRVVTAEYAGAYGNMVEVDHGHGVTSRYAHLSGIVVAVGDAVEPGSVLGHVGSTGRSTGPHLHYETRIGGDAVNPHRFLKAGRQLPRLARDLPRQP